METRGRSVSIVLKSESSVTRSNGDLDAPIDHFQVASNDPTLKLLAQGTLVQDLAVHTMLHTGASTVQHSIRFCKESGGVRDDHVDSTSHPMPSWPRFDHFSIKHTRQLNKMKMETAPR